MKIRSERIIYIIKMNDENTQNFILILITIYPERAVRLNVSTEPPLLTETIQSE